MKRVSASPRANCGPHGARSRAAEAPSPAAFARAAAMFRAAGDPARLRLIHELSLGERCVSDLAASGGAKLSTLSQQLRVLHSERIVARRRSGKHIFYSLADSHVRKLVRAALEHALEA